MKKVGITKDEGGTTTLQSVFWVEFGGTGTETSLAFLVSEETAPANDLGDLRRHHLVRSEESRKEEGAGKFEGRGKN